MSSCLLNTTLKVSRMIEMIFFVKTSPLHPSWPKLLPGIIIEKKPQLFLPIAFDKKHIVFIYSYVKLDPNSCPSIPQGIIIWRNINVYYPRMLSFELSLLCTRFIFVHFAVFVTKQINTWRNPMYYIFFFFTTILLDEFKTRQNR